MRFWAVVLADLVCVLVFAGVGRASHAETVGLVGLAATAGPFVAGAAAGTLAALPRRRPASVVSGLLVWAGAVVLGVLLRVLTGQGAPLSFVVVTAVVLGLLLLGWRAVRAAVVRHRGGRGGSGDRSVGTDETRTSQPSPLG